MFKSLSPHTIIDDNSLDKRIITPMIILVVILLAGVIIEAGIIALLAIALHGKAQDLGKIKSAIDEADSELTER